VRHRLPAIEDHVNGHALATEPCRHGDSQALMVLNN
jgi:hypothetical protein